MVNSKKHDKDDGQDLSRAEGRPNEAEADRAAEHDPAAEWGERIGTSKSIARGGKGEGHVEGASQAKP